MGIDRGVALPADRVPPTHRAWVEVDALMKVPADYAVSGAEAASSPRPSPRPKSGPGASTPGKG